VNKSLSTQVVFDKIIILIVKGEAMYLKKIAAEIESALWHIDMNYSRFDDLDKKKEKLFEIQFDLIKKIAAIKNLDFSEQNLKYWILGMNIIEKPTAYPYVTVTSLAKVFNTITDKNRVDLFGHSTKEIKKLYIQELTDTKNQQEPKTSTSEFR